MPKGEERQLPAVEIEKWIGLVKNASPLVIPPGGAQVQVNLCAITHGILQTRGGLRDVSFEN